MNSFCFLYVVKSLGIFHSHQFWRWNTQLIATQFPMVRKMTSYRIYCWIISQSTYGMQIHCCHADALIFHWTYVIWLVMEFPIFQRSVPRATQTSGRLEMLKICSAAANLCRVGFTTKADATESIIKVGLLLMRRLIRTNHLFRKAVHFCLTKLNLSGERYLFLAKKDDKEKSLIAYRSIISY